MTTAYRQKQVFGHLSIYLCYSGNITKVLILEAAEDSVKYEMTKEIVIGVRKRIRWSVFYSHRKMRNRTMEVESG